MQWYPYIKGYRMYIWLSNSDSNNPHIYKNLLDLACLNRFLYLLLPEMASFRQQFLKPLGSYTRIFFNIVPMYFFIFWWQYSSHRTTATSFNFMSRHQYNWIHFGGLYALRQCENIIVMGTVTKERLKFHCMGTWNGPLSFVLSLKLYLMSHLGYQLYLGTRRSSLFWISKAVFT